MEKWILFSIKCKAFCNLVYASLSVLQLLWAWPHALCTSPRELQFLEAPSHYPLLFLMHGGSLFIIHHTVSNDVCSKWCAYSSHNDHHLAQQANMSAFKFKFQYHLLLRGFPIDSCLPPQEEGYPLYAIQTLSWCLHQWPILNLFWPAKWEFLSGKDVPLFIELGGYTGEYQLLN